MGDMHDMRDVHDMGDMHEMSPILLLPLQTSPHLEQNLGHTSIFPLFFNLFLSLSSD